MSGGGAFPVQGMIEVGDCILTCGSEQTRIVQWDPQVNYNFCFHERKGHSNNSHLLFNFICSLQQIIVFGVCGWGESQLETKVLCSLARKHLSSSARQEDHHLEHRQSLLGSVGMLKWRWNHFIGGLLLLFSLLSACITFISHVWIMLEVRWEGWLSVDNNNKLPPWYNLFKNDTAILTSTQHFLLLSVYLKAKHNFNYIYFFLGQPPFFFPIRDKNN